MELSLLLPLLPVMLLTRCPCPPLLSPSTLSPSFKHHSSARKLHNPAWQTSLGMDTLDSISHRHATKTSGRLSRTSPSFIVDVSHGVPVGRERKGSLAWFRTLGYNRHAWWSFFEWLQLNSEMEISLLLLFWRTLLSCYPGVRLLHYTHIRSHHGLTVWKE